MWPFKKHVDSLSKAGVLQGMTDWHSHILPGVDDGIRTMDDALAVLRYMEQAGVRKVWLTPHVMEDFPNSPAVLKDLFGQLEKKWKGNVEIELAAENMMDSLFEERLEKKDLLPIGQKKDHLLVETSYFNPPMGMDDLIDRIFHAGYFPLLAHPERYRYMVDDDYHRLREKGVRFQLNYLSLAGGYGETARKRAEWLLKQGYADVIGSDVHRLAALQTLADRAPSRRDINSQLSLLAKQSDL